jgi:hypothetical protein
MKVDESILQLAEKFDAWLDGFLSMLDSQDIEAQSKELLNAIKIAKEFDRLKADGFAAITELLHARNGQVESLVQGFVLSAKLWRALSEMDPDGVKESGMLMHALVMRLDGLPDGRTNLVALLDDPDEMVRVCAGEYLIKLMPERVTELLRGINEKNDGSEACIRAGSVLFVWEHEQKAQGNSNDA